MSIGINTWKVSQDTFLNHTNDSSEECVLHLIVISKKNFGGQNAL